MDNSLADARLALLCKKFDNLWSINDIIDLDDPDSIEQENERLSYLP